MTAEIKNIINEFFDGNDPKIYCLTGKWGVGKTHLFNEVFESKKKNNEQKCQDYFYISLFGIFSIDNLRNKVELKILGNHISKATEIFKQIKSAIPYLNKIDLSKISIFKQIKPAIPYLNKIDLSKISISDLYDNKIFQNKIICFDDIERKSAGLKIDEFFGFISDLKERQKCKILLILNDEELKNDKEDYKKYFEKIIDHHIKLNRQEIDSFGIVFKNFKENDLVLKYEPLLKEKLEKLKINNIRIIEKLFGYVKKLVNKLNEIDSPKIEDETYRDALTALCLFFDGKFSPQNEKRRPSNQQILKNELNEEEKNFLWNFGGHIFNLSPIFQEIHDFIENGYFSEKFKEIIIEFNKHYVKNSKKQKFNKAWEKFHGSFQDNKDEVVNEIYESFIDGIDELNLSDLNGIYKILNDLDDVRKEALLDQFYQANKDKKEKFKDDNRIFCDIKEIKEFAEESYKKILKENFKNIKIEDVVDNFLNKSDIKNNQENKFYLEQYSVDDFFDFFVNNNSFDNLKKINLSENYGLENAREAMEKIKNSGKINELRYRYIKGQ